MAFGSEFTANALQTVATNANVLFTEQPVCGSRLINHREGSGLVTLRPACNQCATRYRVTFNANVAVPEGGVVGPVSLAIALNGEAVPSTTMTVTPTVAEAFFNVAASIYVAVPAGCCVQLSVKNIGTGASVQNANLIADPVN